MRPVRKRMYTKETKESSEININKCEQKNLYEDVKMVSSLLKRSSDRLSASCPFASASLLGITNDGMNHASITRWVFDAIRENDRKGK